MHRRFRFRDAVFAIEYILRIGLGSLQSGPRLVNPRVGDFHARPEFRVNGVKFRLRRGYLRIRHLGCGLRGINGLLGDESFGDERFLPLHLRMGIIPVGNGLIVGGLGCGALGYVGCVQGFALLLGLLIRGLGVGNRGSREFRLRFGLLPRGGKPGAGGFGTGSR